MRKLLISVLLLALIALFVMIVASGVRINNFELGHSIKAIINKNTELDVSIGALGGKIDQEYKIAKNSLDTSFRRLQAEKQTYQNTIAFTSSEEINEANQSEQYKLAYLWTNIGLYAKKYNVAMKADLSHGSSGVNNQYNISFTAVGEYISISEFIYAIEKDSTLGFRIEEFAMVPYSEEYLQATFIIKNISIDPSSLSSSASVSSGTVTSAPDQNNNSNNNGQSGSNSNANSNNQQS